MEPVNFSMRSGCHWHLSEILKAEKEAGYKGAREKILEFLDDSEGYYDYLVDFLYAVFRQECATRMAVFQYLCAQNRICYTKAPAYMDFMPKVYNGCDDLNNDRVESYYLSYATKEKLRENEKLEAACKKWEKMYQDKTENRAESVTDENVTIKFLTEQLAEKDKQIEALMELLQKQKDNQQ